ncbi:Transcriptional regulatory protein DegU [subsurface metagenome]
MQMKKKITILLADDQHMVRQGIRQLLEREMDFEVVGEADNTKDAVRLAHELKPDVIIMQARRPTLGGVDAIRQCKAEHPQTAIIILTMYQEEEYVAELLEAGAAGYILKTAHYEELVRAIHSVRAGEFACDVALMQRILKRVARPQPVAVDYGQRLTRRETEVLNLAAKGMSNRDIAGYLVLTEGTVKGYIVNIFGKMSVGSRTEAVLEAIKRGWVSAEEDKCRQR